MQSPEVTSKRYDFLLKWVLAASTAMHAQVNPYAYPHLLALVLSVLRREEAAGSVYGF